MLKRHLVARHLFPGWEHCIPKSGTFHSQGRNNENVNDNLNLNEGNPFGTMENELLESRETKTKGQIKEMQKDLACLDMSFVNPAITLFADSFTILLWSLSVSLTNSFIYFYTYLFGCFNNNYHDEFDFMGKHPYICTNIDIYCRTKVI